jgi:hypothetical protein
VLLGRCAAEVIETNVEPFIHFLVNLVVLGAKILGRQLLLQGLSLSCCSIFVGSANVQCRATTSLVVSELY